MKQRAARRTHGSDCPLGFDSRDNESSTSRMMLDASIFKTRHTTTNSRTSNHRSLRSYLETNDWGLSSRLASSRCVNPASVRAEISRRSNTSYWSVNTICQLSLYRCHEAKARGVATSNSLRHSAHGPGNHQEKKEPQTAGNTTAGQRARPVYQMPSRTCHTKQGPLRGVLQKEQRIPNRQKAEARQARNALEQTCCRRAKRLFLVYTGACTINPLSGGLVNTDFKSNRPLRY